MKKKLLILVLMMTMTLTACGGKDKEETKESTKTTESTEATEEQVEPLTDEEVTKLENYLNSLIETEIGMYESEIDKENRIVTTRKHNRVKNDKENIDEFTNLSKELSSQLEGSVKLVVNYKKDESKTPLFIFKDGKLLENKIELAEKEEKKQEKEKKKNATVFETDNGKYEMTDYELIRSKYDKNVRVLVITMNYTNKSDEAQSPWMSFVGDVSATQETDSTEEILDGVITLVPDSYKPEAASYWDKKIKPGATVEVIIPYELVSTNPVELVDFITEGKKFSKTINIK